MAEEAELKGVGKSADRVEAEVLHISCIDITITPERRTER